MINKQAWIFTRLMQLAKQDQVKRQGVAPNDDEMSDGFTNGARIAQVEKEWDEMNKKIHGEGK